METNDYDKLREERDLEAYKALIRGYRSLDPKDPDFEAKAKALSEIHKQLAADDSNSETAYHNRAQEEQEEKHHHLARITEIGKVVAGGLAAAGAIAGTVFNVWSFKRVTAYEKNVDEGAPGAFRSLGDREIVQKSIRKGLIEK